MRRAPRQHAEQRGYILLGILIFVAVMMIALSATLPAIGTAIKRDREEELVHRGKQYQRAIQLYYRKFGRYPSSLEQLENTNNLRFLRKRYVDPITGKDEWKLVRFGTALPKPPPPYLPNAAGIGTGSTGGISGGTPAGQNGTNQPTTIGTSASSISSAIGNGQTFGGGPIVGVASTSTKEGLKEIDGRTHYNEWEFTYDPRYDNSRSAPGSGIQPGNVNPNGQPGNPNSPGVIQPNNVPGPTTTPPSPH